MAPLKGHKSVKSESPSSSSKCEISSSSSDPEESKCNISSTSSDPETSSSSDEDTVSCSPAPSRVRCNQPGRRIIGGRIYDSELGVTCHWCRQKTVEDHVFCCHCPIAFCGGCLRNRHGEDVKVEMKDSVEWTCPKCRGGCGRGCNNCCNCGPCRKAQGLEPTGLFVHVARAHGFTNVHDYLIHQKTGESEEAIENRKKGRDWCHTDPSSFRKKQKRSETDNRVEASCRRRLNFSQSEGSKERSSVGASTMKIREVMSTAAPDASKLDNNVQVTKIKIEENTGSSKLKENARKHSLLLSKSMEYDHSQSNLQVEKAPISENIVLVQPKPEPEEYDSRVDISHANITHGHLQACDGMPLADMPQPQNLSSSDCQTQLHSNMCISNHKLAVKEERLQFSNGVSDILQKVKTEQVNLCYESSTCNSATIELQKSVGKAIENKKGNSVQEKNEGFPQQMTVKAEISEQGSQHHNEQISQKYRSDITRSTFSLDFAIPSQRMEVHSHLSSALPEGTCRICKERSQEQQKDTCCCPSSLNVGVPFQGADPCSGKPLDPTYEVGELAGKSVSNFHFSPNIHNFELYPRTNFHLYPGSAALGSSLEIEGFDKQIANMSSFESKLQAASCVDTQDSEVLYQQLEKAQDSRVMLDKANSQERRCSVSEDASCLDNAKAVNFAPVAVIQGASKGSLKVKPTSQISSLSGLVKVKIEKEDLSFDVNRVRRPTISKNKSKKQIVMGADVTQTIGIDSYEDLPNVITVNKLKALNEFANDGINGHGDFSHLWKADDFTKKLEVRLGKPFNDQELQDLIMSASQRKPIYRVRETRQGSSQFISEEEGYSYLDHHPDLAWRLEECASPFSKLSLLRGFFFWLEHASLPGAFKPWISAFTSSELGTQENADCVEVEGPDCKVLAVVCPID